ncbi:Hsp20/alpha crystallin family protein [Thioalbus denitrificans]|jgi:HSP20 family protein|uniref:HSP20 family protein n=1 Tax=Thioalbus denitrificans TaxID=547122 RepID=A0A369CAI1_9GAMM|nr:Hsp20/alpha crystallin family protein [Thioalbus denitrificans]RCX31040.1 HSP20 family protein [Thioalbus denitrificans]
MTIVRYDPWATLNQLQEEMNRLFKRAGDEDTGTVVTSDWAPPVDIKEEKDRFVLLADVPGVDPKDIEITMENGVLAIRGERKLEPEEERKGFHRMERARGVFYRRFALPDTADAEKIAASGRNGVLEVVIPKQEKVQPRKIVVEG